MDNLGWKPLQANDIVRTAIPLWNSNGSAMEEALITSNTSLRVDSPSQIDPRAQQTSNQVNLSENFGSYPYWGEALPPNFLNSPPLVNNQPVYHENLFGCETANFRILEQQDEQFKNTNPSSLYCPLSSATTNSTAQNSLISESFFRSRKLGKLNCGTISPSEESLMDLNSCEKLKGISFDDHLGEIVQKGSSDRYFNGSCSRI